MTSIESATVEGVCCKMLLTTRQMIISVINQLARCPCDHCVQCDQCDQCVQCLDMTNDDDHWVLTLLIRSDTCTEIKQF